MMDIAVKADVRLTGRERLQLEALFKECFLPDEVITQWASDDWAVLVWENDELVSHVGVVERTASVDGHPVRLGGIGGRDWPKRL